MKTLRPQPCPPAWVTGADGGIGGAIALALAQRGHPVALQTHRQHARADALLERIRDLAPGSLVVTGDVADADSVKRLADTIQTALGPPLILVNAAGIMHTQFLALTRPETWRRAHAVNLDGAFLTLQAVVRGMMRARWGRIVNIGSVAGLTGDVMRSAYAASKAGLTGLTTSAARELAGAGITVNLIAPGLVDTDMTAEMPPARRQRLLTQIPLRRFGQPCEIAAVADFLCSDAAAYITGETLVVDGGLYGRR